MSLNKGHLTANRDTQSDEMYTPYYAAEPIVKYINPALTVWCPFDKEWSAYVRMFSKNGNQVIATHIDDGQDFFTYEPEHYDVIISNPPFSKKDAVLKRLYELNKPFAVLLPLNSLQGKGRFEIFKQGGAQMLVFDSRCGFHNPVSIDKTVENTPFACAYFCRGLLPCDLIFEQLKRYKKPLEVQS
ncbi:MAG: class I SAM-dependent methyltransferase [Deferribacterales bacterium]